MPDIPLAAAPGEHLDQFEVFPWNENFETGHAIIDEQHKKLVALLNTLANTLVANNVVEVNAAFGELAEYAHRHFEEEEAIWAEKLLGDDWFENHCQNHAHFLPQVVELKEKEKNAPLSQTVEHIVKFLIRWLAFHIIDDDKRLALVIEEIDKGKPIEEAKVIADKKMSGAMRLLIETILNMYDGLSSRTLDLMRERMARQRAERELQEANKRLEALSITDQLTGLYNRRYLETTFNTELRRARREKSELVYYLIDIDFFKKYNDHYGHIQGDVVLEKVGGALLEACRRPGDYAFRLGGEEFGVLVTTQTDTNIGAFGEILRRAIADMEIEHIHNEGPGVVTASIGAVAIAPNDETTLEDYYRVADERLYRAKSEGRNQVVSTD